MFKADVQSKYTVVAEEIGVFAEELFTDESGKYWGNEGAGGLFYAEDTKCLCFAHRSASVNEPNTWGTWGGALDGDETPEEGVRREVHEETGYTGKMSLKKLYVFEDKKFRYTNFLIIVPTQFTPRMNWETQGFSWVSLDSIPSPLHPGAKKLLPHLRRVLNEKSTTSS